MDLFLAQYFAFFDLFRALSFTAKYTSDNYIKFTKHQPFATYMQANAWLTKMLNKT